VIRTGELSTRSASDPSVEYGSVGGLRWLKQIQELDPIEKPEMPTIIRPVLLAVWRS
jgi:hypothetical protein